MPPIVRTDAPIGGSPWPALMPPIGAGAGGGSGPDMPRPLPGPIGAGDFFAGSEVFSAGAGASIEKEDASRRVSMADFGAGSTARPGAASFAAPMSSA